MAGGGVWRTRPDAPPAGGLCGTAYFTAWIRPMISVAGA